jgi:ketosteroid isomerase-like protein
MSDDEIRAQTIQLATAYQTLIGRGKWDEWIDLWAEDGVLEFPFAPPGRQGVYRGKDEILAYMKAASGKMKIDGITAMRVQPALDPHGVTVELTVTGTMLKTGKPYDQKYVFFFEVRDGKLAAYREYWNPLISIDANNGDRDGWTAAFGTPLT